jgi:hypothetical protein
MEYNPQGEMVGDRKPHLPLRERYIWGDVAGKRMPLRVERIFEMGDEPVVFVKELDYDENGFLIGFTDIRPAIDFVYQENFSFTPDAEGIILVENARRPDLNLLILPDGNYAWPRTREKYGKLADIAPNIKKFHTNDFLQKGRYLLKNQNEQFDYTEELHPSGMVQSMTWRYQLEEAKGHADFVLAKAEGNWTIHLRGELWCTIHPEEKAVRVVLQSSGNTYYYPANKDPRELAVEFLLGRNQLFMQDQRFDQSPRIHLPLGNAPQGKPYHIDYELHPDQSVHKRKRSIIKPIPFKERCKILTGDDLRWDQYEEFAFDEQGNEMQLVGQLQSGDVFGSYYLFYSPENASIAFVFQCT